MTGSRVRKIALAATVVSVGAWMSASPGRPAEPAGSPVPRTILALFDGTRVQGPRWTNIHQFADTPLGHLGLVVRYHDIRTGLPAPESLSDIRGVITWFAADAMPDPLGYLQWLETVARQGKRIAIIGPLGVSHDDRGNATPPESINRVLQYLGWRFDGGWLGTTYGARYRIADRGIVGFERPLPAVAPPYARVTATSADARVVLQVSLDGRRNTDSDLVILTPRGTYVAPGYAAYAERLEDEPSRQWYLNPFELFREAFGTDDLPKADAATVSGRRIYYSHIDGDGWRNLTQVEPYRTRYVVSARVVLDEIIRKYPDFPVTVGAIAGDLDPAWHGTRDSLSVAREIYAERQVEPAVHTYSHPLKWSMFDPKAPAARNPDDEVEDSAEVSGVEGAKHGRSYIIRPFSLRTEFDDAAAFVNGLLPAGKKVGLVQWPGDTRPFEQAIARARALGFANINGGDTRFDQEFPSIAWVAPLGIRVGNEVQVYASNSNENTYTDLWRDRFYGFAYLARTVRNTGAPRRLKPFNIYYHMYSGERLSSLNAVLANLAWARTMALAPVETSRFSRIVEGYFATTFDAIGPRTWRVRNRGALETVRIDQAAFEAVDFARSTGIAGQRHEFGSLYVSLDQSVTAPVIALKKVANAAAEPRESVAYLVESRWRVFNVARDPGRVSFSASGYGAGEFIWQWPTGDPVVVRWHSRAGARGEMQATPGASGLLAFRLPQMTGEDVSVTIAPVTGAAHAR